MICSSLPARLGHAGDEAPVRLLTEADPADSELAEYGAGTTADVAAGIGAHREFWGPPRLDDQRFLCQVSPPSVQRAEGYRV